MVVPRETYVLDAKRPALHNSASFPRRLTFGMEHPRFAAWRPHPWHGLDIGREPPIFVNAYIEITPFDLINYEIDKVTGYLRVDRPQRTSSQAPALYGFIPQTYCGERIAALCPGASRGDGD